MDDPYSDEIPPLTAVDDAPPVRSEADLLVRWRQLMGPWGFGGRSLWVLWFDEVGRQLPIVVPIDDIPDAPDDRFVDNLMYIVGRVLRGHDEDGGDGRPPDDADDADGAHDDHDSPDVDGTPAVAMTLSRPGSSRLTDSDRAWARAVRAGAERAGVVLWPLHLATKGSVRPLTLDDVGWARPA